jgi:hypothetical protein
MAFDGKEGEEVTLEQASGWTANFRNGMAPGAIKAHFMGEDLIRDIVKQPGCQGIRIYNGVNDAGEACLIFVGADANEDDMIGSGDVIADYTEPCPPFCGSGNSLNGDST